MTGIARSAIGRRVAALAAVCAAIPLSVALALPASADPMSPPQPLDPYCIDYDGDGNCDAYGNDDYNGDEPQWECVPPPESPWACPD